MSFKTKVQNGVVARFSALKLIVINLRLWRIYKKYINYTMIPMDIYILNLRLLRKFREVPGSIVECGAWRGGMMAGMASVLPGRNYYLYDSFEGLPEAKEIDGPLAIHWQKNKKSPLYFNNCKAEIDCAKTAMLLTNEKRFKIIKGWFASTLKTFPSYEDIAILRLDGDWYDSTMESLEILFPRVIEGGLIIVDDYTTWTGCRKAVHDYLSKRSIDSKILQFENKVTFLIK